MLTVRSLIGPPPVLGELARRMRQVGRRVLAGDTSIERIEIAVFRSSSSPSTTTPCTATRAAIDRAGAGVDADVTIRRAPPARVSSDPNVLWLLVLDGAELEPHALSRFTALFDGDADLDMAYGDAGARRDSDSGPEIDGPWLLPGFSPDRLADQFYVGHVVAVRAGRSTFGPNRRSSTSPSDTPAPQNGRDETEGPWTLVAAARSVVHIPEPLYRPAPGVGLWEPVRTDRHHPRMRREDTQDGLPPVSVIIPTNGSCRTLQRGLTRLVDGAVRSVLDSRYPRIEIVVVLTPGSPDELPQQLRGIVDQHRVPGRTLVVVTDDRPFNFSNACNRGAVASTGDVLVFLNDDTEVIARDWLTELVRHARKPEVGPVGARLLYEDGRVQHSGIWSRGGHPTHRYEGRPGDATGYLGALRVTQNCLAVTGACLAVERAKFDLVGGFSPVFPNSYNDVDLCLKLWDRGYRTVVEPRAELFHFEASTRDPSITDDDLAALHDRWRRRLNHDPFDNPNHTAERSEEWPLPLKAPPASGEEPPQPRRWPLEPIGRFTPS